MPSDGKEDEALSERHRSTSSKMHSMNKGHHLHCGGSAPHSLPTSRSEPHQKYPPGPPHHHSMGHSSHQHASVYHGRHHPSLSHNRAYGGVHSAPPHPYHHHYPPSHSYHPGGHSTGAHHNYSHVHNHNLAHPHISSHHNPHAPSSHGSIPVSSVPISQRPPYGAPHSQSTSSQKQTSKGTGPPLRHPHSLAAATPVNVSTPVFTMPSDKGSGSFGCKCL